MDAALQTAPLPAPRFSALVDRAAARTTGAGTGQGTGGKVDPATDTKLRRAANDFETQFVSQMLTPMFDTVEVDPMFGGGHGEEMFRSLLVNEYGKQMTTRGGFGIADSVYRELLRAQEASTHG